MKHPVERRAVEVLQWPVSTSSRLARGTQLEGERELGTMKRSFSPQTCSSAAAAT